MKQFEVALLGAGLMGRFHGRTLAGMAGVRLAVVVDADAERAAAVAALSPGTRATADEGVAFDGAIDAVVIATPAATHVELITRAAESGLAVFCEKPLGLSLAQAERAGRALEASRHGVPAGLPATLRSRRGTAPTARRRGRPGQRATFRSMTADPQGPDLEGMRQAAGIFHDTLSHDADLALAVGGPVEEVFTRGAAMTDERFTTLGKPDTTVISLSFASGALGVIENRLRTGFGYETVLEVGGSLAKGIVRDDALDALTLMRHDRSERSFVPWFLERFERAYRAELEVFFECLREGRRPEPGFDQGLAVLRLCLAAERSYREGSAVRPGETG
jgi:predicted dehydrogenase